LELAGGTGWWTARLARTAEHLTVVDSSPESLELNRKHVGRSDADYIVADVITWQPPRTFEVVRGVLVVVSK
jgi:demethylmenaquinone methyltransferase/2-methoxy-6-polyprenyl-1,4-benzoquinol methylase